VVLAWWQRHKTTKCSFTKCRQAAAHAIVARTAYQAVAGGWLSHTKNGFATNKQ